jgi:hypothetical protein
VRVSENGPQKISYMVLANGGAMKIELSFWASPFPEMKNVLTAYYRMTPPQHQKYNEYPILRLDIGPPDPIELEVRNPAELESSLPRVLEEFERGLRFLEKAKSIAGVDELLNSPGEMASFQRRFPRPAVLVAYLTNSPNFHEVADSVMWMSQGRIDMDHELLSQPVEHTIRDEQGLHLLVDDLRNGVLRDYKRDGEHPLLFPALDPVVRMEELAAHSEQAYARAEADRVALQGDLYDRGYGSIDSDSEGDFPYGEVYEPVQLSGFDADGEPSIRVYPDGRLMLVFEFMPPSAWEMDATDAGMLGTDLSNAIGLDLSEEQPGFFLVAHPAPDTIEHIRNFVANYRQSHGYSS